MSYAIDIEPTYDGRVRMALPGIGQLTVSRADAVTIGLALLKEADDAWRVSAWVDWALDHVVPEGEAQDVRDRAKAGILKGLPCPEGFDPVGEAPDA